MNSMSVLLSLAIFGIALQVAYCANLAEVLKSSGLNVALELAESAGLADALAKDGPFTVFAPTDQAFDELSKIVTDGIENDKAVLEQTLKYHLVPGAIRAADIANDVALKTVQGANVRTNVYLKSEFFPGLNTVNGKKILATDLEADNGIVHIIESVLYPLPQPSVIEILYGDPMFERCMTALGSSSLLGSLMADPGPWTIFAPTNAAFEKFSEEEMKAFLSNTAELDDTLKRHAVRGTYYRRGFTWNTVTSDSGDELQLQVFKNDVYKISSKSSGSAMVTKMDLQAENVVVHAVDALLD